ncbi:Fe-S cluster assembly protein SufD [Thiococcus pfennigii]|uniref:Fe-S cluster assembly protein SufD n=1 Tax=Thiococcus pfennigii TaxID=1057 RepID=UPI00190316A3|nr:Fe-S cluster assembly protein SufD [Thiococcus pfennigii]MBK1701075.1 Fe-S cluster assembly protein SufD [Thiococcus pfennigii]
MNAQPLGQFEDWLPGGGAIDLPGADLDWLATARQRALASARALGVPTARHEAWRYTSLKGLIEQAFTPYGAAAPGARPDDLEAHLIAGLDSHRVVLVDGRFAPGLSDLGDLPAGLRIAGLGQLLSQDPDALQGRLTGVAGTGAHLFAALNTVAMRDGLVVLVEPGVRLARPIELIHLAVGTERPGVAQPRTLIALGEGAEATLVERFVGTDEAHCCTNLVGEVALGRAATLGHYRVQTEGAQTFHISALHIALESQSRYRGLNVGLGAAWARTDLVARFAGEGAECDLSGLYLAGDRQLIDFHLDVDHAVPGCASRERFKGILHGKGRAVFDGRVLVARDAQQSDAEMVNNNLLLSANAEIDTKPQLEIYADDVKCSHGTTVGQIEPETLFYLRARGIPAIEARRMLCLAFAEEILADLRPLGPLHGHVAELVGARLERVAFD